MIESFCEVLKYLLESKSFIHFDFHKQIKMKLFILSLFQTICQIHNIWILRTNFKCSLVFKGLFMFFIYDIPCLLKWDQKLEKVDLENYNYIFLLRSLSSWSLSYLRLWSKIFLAWIISYKNVLYYNKYHWYK